MPLEPRLPDHKVIPSWTLTDGQGRPWSLFKPRGRAHTVLVVAGPGLDLKTYLGDLAAGLTEVQTLPARGVAVIDPAYGVVVAPPWTVLLDQAGAVRERYLPDAAKAGVFILDRYNDLYYQWLSADGTDMPTATDVVDWLTAVGRQCSI